MVKTFLILFSHFKQGFTINERTGDIVMTSQLDREAVSEVSLKVLAGNHGVLTGNSTDVATVRVLIRDANDPPLFTERLYKGVVKENSEEGTSVIQVSTHVLCPVHLHSIRTLVLFLHFHH